jgi:hypothetical protein
LIFLIQSLQDTGRFTVEFDFCAVATRAEIFQREEKMNLSHIQLNLNQYGRENWKFYKLEVFLCNKIHLIFYTILKYFRKTKTDVL